MSTPVKVVLIILALLVIAGGAALGIGAWLYVRWDARMNALPDRIAISMAGPDAVAVADRFRIEITVENIDDEAHVIDSIDIYDSYLEGVDVIASRPAWNGSGRYADFVSYDYGTEIPAGSTQVVTFDLEAVAEGEFSGDFDVCIDDEVTYMTLVVRTIVRPEP